MTPRQQDLAYVLEDVAGVRAVFAITPGSKAAAYLDFAIELGSTNPGKLLAETTYALHRVMTPDECARVSLCAHGIPAVIAESATALGRLTPTEREQAQARVPAVLHEAYVQTWIAPKIPMVLVVDTPEVQQVVREALGGLASCWVASRVPDQRGLGSGERFDLILCGARFAFGVDGMLAVLPIELASRVVVLVERSEIVDAHWRLQGSSRMLVKPLEAWVLRDRLSRVGIVPTLDESERDHAITSRPRRTMSIPSPSTAFTAILVDVDDEIHDALRRVFREDARHLSRRDPIESAELALTLPVHLVVCSANAALHPRSVIERIAIEDPAGADRVVVVARAHDVAYLRHKLERLGRKNPVLALPIDDTRLRRELFDLHPELAAKLATIEIATDEPTLLTRAVTHVLVVDDDTTTQILFSARGSSADDVSLARTTVEAFEHVVSRPVDLLVISATMRADSGEPFYRVLWRMKPELKARTVLVMAPDLVPPSLPPSAATRIVERPLTRDAIARVVSTFAKR